MQNNFQTPQAWMGTVTTQNFMAKVLLFFGLAILTSAAGTFTGFQYLGPLFITNPFLIYLFFAIELGLVFTSRMWSANRPLNYFLFALFAFVTGLTIVPFLLSIIAETGGAILIMKALLATTFAFGASALFAWVTQRDLTGIGGFLTMALIGMIIVSIIGIFLPWSNTFEIIFSGFGVAVFSGYVMYDIQTIRNSQIDNPIEAALRLYLDIFNLFIYILRLLSGVSRRQ